MFFKGISTVVLMDRQGLQFTIRDNYTENLASRHCGWKTVVVREEVDYEHRWQCMEGSCVLLRQGKEGACLSSPINDTLYNSLRFLPLGFCMM